jgi:hypothetical protein
MASQYSSTERALCIYHSSSNLMPVKGGDCVIVHCARSSLAGKHDMKAATTEVFGKD